MIAPKSAIEAAAMISCPNVVASSPESLSTGTSTPSDVAQSMIATSSGVSTRSSRAEPERDDQRDRERDREAHQREAEHAPAQLLELDLQPGEEQHEARPSNAITSIASSTSTQPSTDGPTTIPATISSTTAGSRRLGNSPSSSGAVKATAMTMSRFVTRAWRVVTPHALALHLRRHAMLRATTAIVSSCWRRRPPSPRGDSASRARARPCRARGGRRSARAPRSRARAAGGRRRSAARGRPRRARRSCPGSRR